MEASNEFNNYTFLNLYLNNNQNSFDYQLLQTDNANDLIKNIWVSTKDDRAKGLPCVEFFKIISNIPQLPLVVQQQALLHLKEVVHAFISSKIDAHKMGFQATDLFQKLQPHTPKTKRSIDDDLSPRINKRVRSPIDNVHEKPLKYGISEKLHMFLKAHRDLQQRSFHQIPLYEILQIFGYHVTPELGSSLEERENITRHMKHLINEQMFLARNEHIALEINSQEVPQVLLDVWEFLQSIQPRF